MSTDQIERFYSVVLNDYISNHKVCMNNVNCYYLVGWAIVWAGLKDNNIMSFWTIYFIWPYNMRYTSYRPCAMVVPDFELIAEIMLVAEGFIDARILARKFLTLYTLCKELLSKQDHYDWGLRAIKSVLVVAGALKRGDRGRPEDQVNWVVDRGWYYNESLFWF